MRIAFLGAFLAIFAIQADAQEAQTKNKFWVFLSDKGPELDQSQLSTKEFDNSSIHQPYVSQVRDAGYEVVNYSKWFNAIVVSSDCAPLDLPDEFSFVKSVRPVAELVRTRESSVVFDAPVVANGDKTYGYSAWQNNMINIGWLHERGFRGEGMRMAVFDAGFYRMNEIGGFDSLWDSGRVLAYWDFSENDSMVFEDDNHGMAVISTIAANDPGNIVGTAPMAKFLLARTEVAASETRQEEANWVRAVEWADSIGVDIIHSSLGYSTFDSDDESYTYEDMDGGTAMITRAADKAAARGILIVTSAGNEGLGRWRYITAPCDGDSVLCIGAVDSNMNRAWFSSVGPSFDGRIKPDVSAMGEHAAFLRSSGKVGWGNGTSYAAPMVAGMTACLWQAHPNRSNMDIIKAMQQAGHQADKPDSKIGYGIPNSRTADSLLAVMDAEEAAADQNLNASPITHYWWYNSSDYSTLYIKNLTGVHRVNKVRFLDGAGENKMTVEAKGKKELKKIKISDLPPGKYTLELGFAEIGDPEKVTFWKRK